MADASDKKNMDCENVRYALPEYFYGEADPPVAGALEEHLKTCGSCRREWEGLKNTLELVGKGEMPRVTEEFWEGFWTEFDRKVHERVGKDRRWALPAVIPWPRPAAALAGLALIVTAIYGGFKVYEIREEKALARDYALVRNMELLQDFDVISHLDEVEAAAREGNI